MSKQGEAGMGTNGEMRKGVYTGRAEKYTDEKTGPPVEVGAD